MSFHLHGGILEAAVAHSQSGDFPEIHLCFLPGAEAARYTFQPHGRGGVRPYHTLPHDKVLWQWKKSQNTQKKQESNLNVGG